MIGKFSVVGAMALTLASGAVAAEPEQREAQQPDKKVCKSEKITGSLTRVRRICMTQAEWDKLANDTARDLDRLGRQSNRSEATSVNGSTGL